MKRLMFILSVLVGMAFGVISCIDTDLKGNMKTTTEDPAVATFNYRVGNYTLLSSNSGEVIVPQETAVELEEGQCVLAQLTFDYDNQPNQYYFTASVVKHKPVRYSLARLANTISVQDYDSPIDGVVQLRYDPILRGNYFLRIYGKGVENTTNYQLLAGRDSVDAETGAHELYLLSKINTASGSLVGDNYAFDMSLVLNEFGRDTIFKATGLEIPLRTVNVNLNYLKKMENGEPIFSRVNTDPIEIVIYR